MSQGTMPMSDAGDVGDSNPSSEREACAGAFLAAYPYPPFSMPQATSEMICKD
jgi:hypothetical protein